MSFHFEQLYLVFAARPFPENVPLLHSRMFIINHSNNNNNQKLNEMFCMYKEISYLYEKWFENLVFWLPVCFSLNCFIFMSHIFFCIDVSLTKTETNFCLIKTNPSMLVYIWNTITFSTQEFPAWKVENEIDFGIKM